jgi:GntR family transcriptional repressor for pyruvate dehydrogenase complex
MTARRQFSRPLEKQTLAEQVAAAIKEAILAGEWIGGEALPTEPELSEQFGVSRAVIRDATRMLAAQGLVQAQHGRGVFVTESQAEAFGDALLLALRRSGATSWDVEHFEQILYPEIFALVTVEATDEEIQTLSQAVDGYLETMDRILTEHWGLERLPADAEAAFSGSYRQLMIQFFAATHNQVIELLAVPLLRLRTLRRWQDTEATKEEVLEMEAAYVRAFVDVIASRDPELARESVRQLMQLPPEAIKAMKRTPIGEMPIIPVSWQPKTRPQQQ